MNSGERIRKLNRRHRERPAWCWRIGAAVTLENLKGEITCPECGWHRDDQAYRSAEYNWCQYDWSDGEEDAFSSAEEKATSSRYEVGEGRIYSTNAEAMWCQAVEWAKKNA